MTTLARPTAGECTAGVSSVGVSSVGICTPGECTVGILTEDEWRLARMGKRSMASQHAFYANVTSPLTHHCDTKIALPGAIYFVGNAVAVRDELQAPLSWALTRQEDATPYATLASNAQSRFLKSPEGTRQLSTLPKTL